MTNVFIVDDDGMPIAGVDPEAIAAAGVRLAFDLAANCDDPEALDRITGQYLDQYGAAAFGYLAASALSIVVREVLAPTLQVTDAVGVDLRGGLRAAARDSTNGGGVAAS
ncbi:hypothetical protein [Luteococcus japonicus]|uniref:Uncharacterized protein n=1 Tax=Luteococcus japonicus LSP_Lj1 TaxID=1255658 RepID=A0A1R4K5H1_9ACTN|nr:hypothetical protein [Luteococcus japonicus]SJN39414.1 hypothetical protein FM114_11520 [Luteococcus japonicus LSP_Lj1]